MPLITQEEAASLFPAFQGKKGRMLYHLAMSLTGIDKVSALHEKIESSGVPYGPAFAKGILDELQIDFAIGNPSRLDSLPDGAFITVSNHNYGHIDGICLVDLIGERRPQMKVLVNQLLMYIKGLAPNFISVEPKTNATRAVSQTSVAGLKEAFSQLRSGEPLSLFPSGAVTDIHPREHWSLSEREWQDSAIRLIQKAKVPIVPIRFFDRNSLYYYLLGLLDYRIRFVRLFHEAFNKKGSHPLLGIGPTIPVSKQMQYSSLQDFKAFLRSSVYDMPRPSEIALRSQL